jgi:hypothetical protein
VIAAAITLMARAQSPAITGRVVADESGDPIPNARVTLSTAALGTPVVLTDGDGRFALTAPPGRQSIVASKSGRARSEGISAIVGQPIEIRLHRSAVISGRVVDAFGDPVAMARVSAQLPSNTPTNPTRVASAETDDRGEYRLAGLPAGTFVVAVVTLGPPRPPEPIGNGSFISRGPTPQTTYYPGVSAANEAQAVRLQFGDERPGIDFVVPAGNNEVGNPFSVMRLSPGPLPQATSTVRANGIVRGRVVSTDGRGLAHAQVRLIGNKFGVLRTTTADGDGGFEFTDVPAGKFAVVASKTGYSPVGPDDSPLGLMLNSGRTFDLAEGETREKVDLSLARWGTLAGRVFDELGDPIQGASVQVLHIRYEAGRRRLVPAGGAGRVTDDLGRYRLYALAPGRYVVSATIGDVASADLPGYTRSYFPGTANPSEAQFASMGVSQDLAGIDFTMARTRTARVAGKLIDAAGAPTTGGTVQLMPSRQSTSVTSVPVGARILPDGQFEFANVPPGAYIIQAYRGRSQRWIEGEFGTLPVTVNGRDVTDLTLQTSSGSSIKGRFTFDTYNGSKPPAASAIELTPIPIDFDLSPQNNWGIAEIHADWSFDLAGVNGPRRLQLTRVPPGWALKEIRVNRIDVTDRPRPFGRKDQSLSDVEVVLTDRVSEVSGTIADDRAKPAPGARIVAFSMDRDRWYPASRFLRTTIAGSDGTFTLSGLPYGSYYAAAVAQLPTEGEDAWQDPAFLESLVTRASTVTLGEAQKISLSLRLASR